jgi:hypothetical protein
VLVLPRAEPPARAETLIGSAADADLVLDPSPTGLCFGRLAPHHCRIRSGPEQRHWLEDLEGKGSTFLNGRALSGDGEPQPLSHGDIIQAGGFLLHYLGYTPDEVHEGIPGTSGAQGKSVAWATIPYRRPRSWNSEEPTSSPKPVARRASLLVALQAALEFRWANFMIKRPDLVIISMPLGMIVVGLTWLFTGQEDPQGNPIGVVPLGSSMGIFLYFIVFSVLDRSVQPWAPKDRKPSQAPPEDRGDPSESSDARDPWTIRFRQATTCEVEAGEFTPVPSFGEHMYRAFLALGILFLMAWIGVYLPVVRGLCPVVLVVLVFSGLRSRLRVGDTVLRLDMHALGVQEPDWRGKTRPTHRLLFHEIRSMVRAPRPFRTIYRQHYGTHETSYRLIVHEEELRIELEDGRRLAFPLPYEERHPASSFLPELIDSEGAVSVFLEALEDAVSEAHSAEPDEEALARLQGMLERTSEEEESEEGGE